MKSQTKENDQPFEKCQFILELNDWNVHFYNGTDLRIEKSRKRWKSQINFVWLVQANNTKESTEIEGNLVLKN